MTLSNRGSISGGGGGSGEYTLHAAAGTGGVGILNSGTIGALTNKGTIAGGVGGSAGGYAGNGGEGIANYGTIKTLTNKGSMKGGAGGSGGQYCPIYISAAGTAARESPTLGP